MSLCCRSQIVQPSVARIGFEMNEMKGREGQKTWTLEFTDGASEALPASASGFELLFFFFFFFFVFFFSIFFFSLFFSHSFLLLLSSYLHYQQITQSVSPPLSPSLLLSFASSFLLLLIPRQPYPLSTSTSHGKAVLQRPPPSTQPRHCPSLLLAPLPVPLLFTLLLGVASRRRRRREGRQRGGE